MTLTEFLLERLAEDEAAANRADGEINRGALADPAHHWHARHYEYEGIAVSPGHDSSEPRERLSQYNPASSPTQYVVEWADEVTDLIGRFDPARVLAECEAKRRIVESESAPYPEGHVPATRILRLLALPYVDHPDYREEWRP